MAFTTSKAAGNIILSADWNEFVDYTEYISGSYFGHSGNKDIHYPSSSIIDWLNSVYAQSGVTLSWSGSTEFYGFSSNVHDNYIISSNAISRFTDSSSVNINYLSNISSNAIESYRWVSTSGGTLYFPSSLGRNLIDFSSNTTLTKTGYINITNGGTIAHGLSSLPTYASVFPSGFSTNFGASCKVDEDNITVYLTTDTSRDIFWLATC